MLISMNWISDFVDLTDLDLTRLIQRFSLSTAEVENEIFYKGSDLSGVVVAEIKSVENHPKSEKLHLLKVDDGGEELVDVVCGAPNVRVGMKTAFARVGARLGEISIEPRGLVGYTSYGMCCSERELGISAEHGGIMEIPADALNGTDVKKLYQIDDIVFEVDNKSLTNRPDLWGHYGIAREFATLAGRPLKPMETANLLAYDHLPQIDLKIEDSLCQRYSCLRVENVQQTVSPVNMRIRLFYCGMRAINLLADLTNYLMLEMGQPMHAFDSRRLEKIRIRRFEKPFSFTTLDKVSRSIDENTLMICNGETPVAIAGIMGGLDSEILPDTRSLTLESATFDASSVRKSTVRLAHRTDASQRYEKCLDPEMTVPAIGRFVKLLQEIDGGVRVTSRLTDEYAYHYKEISLDFDKNFVDKYTGISIENDTIVKTLTALGFGVELKDDRFHVSAPSWRATKDVTMKADIIEEITRIYGYDNFAVHTANAPLYPVRISDEKRAEERIKDLLVKRFSLHEVHSYVWAYNDEYKKLGLPVEDNIKLLSAANPNIETIRRSIVPTQLVQVKQNTAFQPSFGLFEIGRTVDGVDENNLCRERKKLAITLFCKTEDVQTLYFKLRDMVAVLLDDLRHQPIVLKAMEQTKAYQHPKNLNAIECAGKVLGEIGVVHPTVAKKIDKKAAIVYTEVDVKELAAVCDAGIHYEEPSRYPAMEIDLSFIADTYAQISQAISKAGSELIRKVAVTDTYSGEKEKSITVRLTFSHPERTLTREEVMEVVNAVIEELGAQGVVLKNS